MLGVESTWPSGACATLLIISFDFWIGRCVVLLSKTLHQLTLFSGLWNIWHLVQHVNLVDGGRVRWCTTRTFDCYKQIRSADFSARNGGVIFLEHKGHQEVFDRLLCSILLTIRVLGVQVWLRSANFAFHLLQSVKSVPVQGQWIDGVNRMSDGRGGLAVSVHVLCVVTKQPFLSSMLGKLLVSPRNKWGMCTCVSRCLVYLDQ